MIERAGPRATLGEWSYSCQPADEEERKKAGLSPARFQGIFRKARAKEQAMNSKPVYKPLPEDLKVIAAMPCLDSMKLGYVPYRTARCSPAVRSALSAPSR